MDNQERFLQILKRVGGICFAIAFIMALPIFGRIGLEYISIPTARYLFIGFGALGLILNLVTFQTGRYQPLYNLTYWGGSIIVFAGLIMNLFRIQFAVFVMIAGLLIVGVSFVLPKRYVERKDSNPDILDD
jgi:archaellum biogenesis protein FlaJ (TadC family)